MIFLILDQMSNSTFPTNFQISQSKGDDIAARIGVEPSGECKKSG